MGIYHGMSTLDKDGKESGTIHQRYKRLKAKNDKLLKTLKRICDDNGRFVNDLAGSEVSDALHYTFKSILESYEKEYYDGMYPEDIK